MKYSHQRELILETVRKTPVHPTAEEVYTIVKQQLPTISLATVYRNLNLLSEIGAIRTLEAANSNSVRYDGRNDEHCHLVCTTCGTITDVELRVFGSIDSTVFQETGFAVLEHGIVLKGTCSTCANKKST